MLARQGGERNDPMSEIGVDGTARDGARWRRAVRLAWRERSVRWQLLATFVLVTTVAAAAASALLIYNARRATTLEIAASVDLAERFVRATVEHLDATMPGGLLLEDLPARLGTMRHVRFLVTTPSGRPAWLSPATRDRPTGEPAAAPAWFAALVADAVPGRSVTVTSGGRRIGTVVVTGDAADEIAEVWRNMTDLAAVALAVAVVVIGVLHVALGRVLDPLSRVAEGLRALESGRFQHRVPVPGVRELRDIAGRFNALAGALGAARAENARLNRRLVDVQDAERRQIAIELHDELGPCLFGLKANAASLGRLAGALPAETGGPLAARAEALIEIAERIQTANRRLLRRVRPMALGHVPLAEALADLVADIRAHATGCAITLETGRLAEGYGDAVDLTVYRCVQEGLTNAARHAGARSVTVTLAEAADGGLRLTIADDGAGMAADAPRGLGLAGMEERVRALGGTLDIDAAAGGTTLAVTIPVRA